MSAVMPRPRDTLLPRQPEGMGRGLMLAIAVHIGLVIALAIGVHWRSREPETMAAELWAAVPQMAAPKAVEPEPPKPAPEPPKPPPAPVPKVETPPPPRDADIAIEKARREKQLQREREERERQEAEKRAAAEKKAAAEKAARERQQQLEAEQRRKEADERRQAAQLAAAREAQMKRIMGMAGASGEANATGQALKSAGPSASYAGRIRARIKPNIVFTDDVPGNPTATVEVRLAPDGTIVGTPRLVQSSGSKAWDDAVVRAVVKTEQLPRDVDGTVPPVIRLDFRPHE